MWIYRMKLPDFAALMGTYEEKRLGIFIDAFRRRKKRSYTNSLTHTCWRKMCDMWPFVNHFCSQTCYRMGEGEKTIFELYFGHPSPLEKRTIIKIRCPLFYLVVFEIDHIIKNLFFRAENLGKSPSLPSFKSGKNAPHTNISDRYTLNISRLSGIVSTQSWE